MVRNVNYVFIESEMFCFKSHSFVEDVRFICYYPFVLCRHLALNIIEYRALFLMLIVLKRQR